MRLDPPFNPLDKRNLGTSVANALIGQERSPLPPSERFAAAGVYAIYYRGSFELYRPIANPSFASPSEEVPIYVGKAVPAGARKGGVGLDRAPGTVLFDRLADHAESISQAENLNLDDFFCRYLAVDDIWIPLGESLLIESYSPLWNRIVEGFGNHDPGSGRHQGKRSAWDVLHPGRPWASRLQSGKNREALIKAVQEFLSRSSDRQR